MSITLKNIADRLGVSQMTVSYALRDHPSIPPVTRERVKGAAKKMGYRPNSAARAMLSGRFGTVASVYTVSREGVRQTSKSDLLVGYSTALHEANMQLTFAAIDPSELDVTQGGKPKLLLERTVDGLLIDYDVRIADELMSELSKLLIPYICVNDKQKSDCVYPDDFGGARAATEFLLAAGHRRIVCYIDESTHGVDGVRLHYSAADRVSGYRAAMVAAAARPRVIAPSSEAAATHTQVRSLLDSRDRPTAVLCVGSDDPSRFMYHATLAGLNVPRDLSIATIHHEQPSAIASISTWHIPFRETGYLAAKQLLQKTEAASVPLAPVSVPYTTVSTGATIAAPVRRTKPK